MTDENKNEQETVIDEVASTDASENTVEQVEQAKEVDTRRIPYERFKQKVDEAIALQEKLAELEREQEEAKRNELEETEHYKELYEQALKQAEEAKACALTTKKNALLAQAGYDEDQAKLLVKLIEGETDEEITASIKQVQATIPAQDNFGDPSAFNGAKDKPETVDAEEVGRNAVSRVLHKIRL